MSLTNARLVCTLGTHNMTLVDHHTQPVRSQQHTCLFAHVTVGTPQRDVLTRPSYSNREKKSVSIYQHNTVRVFVCVCLRACAYVRVLVCAYCAVLINTYTALFSIRTLTRTGQSYHSI